MTGALVDLRCHALGGVDAAFLRQIAFEKHIDLRRAFDAAGGYAISDNDTMWRLIETMGSVLNTPEDTRRMVVHLGQQQADAGVIYAEVVLSPLMMGANCVGAWRDHLLAAQDGSATVARQFGVTLAFGVEIERHAGSDAAKATARAAAETAEEGTQFVTLMGQEQAARFDEFTYCYDMLGEAGLPLVLGIGETGDVRDLSRAVDSRRFARFAHVAGCPADPNVTAHIVAAGYGIDLTPWRPDGSFDPLRHWTSAGAAVALCSDRAGFWGIDVKKGVERVRDALGCDKTAVARIMKDAVEQALCPAATKQEILKKVTDSWTHI